MNRKPREISRQPHASASPCHANQAFPAFQRFWATGRAKLRLVRGSTPSRCGRLQDSALKSGQPMLHRNRSKKRMGLVSIFWMWQEGTSLIYTLRYPPALRGCWHNQVDESGAARH